MSVFTHQTITPVLAKLYLGTTTEQQAEAEIARLGADALAEFLVDLFNRGVLTRSFLGIDDEGEVI